MVAKEELVKKLADIGYNEHLDIEIVNATDNEKERNIPIIYLKNCRGNKVYWKEIVIN